MARARRKMDEVPDVEVVTPAQPALPIPDVEPSNATAPKRYSVTARNHVSFYLPKEMQKAAAQLALDKGRRANEIYVEALRRVLESAGYTSDQLGLANVDRLTIP